jgi:hypothetical protein
VLATLLDLAYKIPLIYIWMHPSTNRQPVFKAILVTENLSQNLEISFPAVQVLARQDTALQLKALASIKEN